MGTWLGVIAETKGRADFWSVARTAGVEPVVAAVPPHVLIECDTFEAPFKVGEELSRALGSTVVAFVAQTVSDVHQLHVFANGERVRRLD